MTENKSGRTKRPPGDWYKMGFMVERSEYKRFKAICAQMGKSYTQMLGDLIKTFNKMKGGIL